MKFVFDKLFKFEQYPEILKCHNEYQDLVDRAYEIEALYENGECEREDWGKAIDKSEAYYCNEYAEKVYKEFYGKGLLVKDWVTKKKSCFDDLFKPPFESLSNGDRIHMLSIVEITYGLKLSAEYYEKK